MEKIPTIFVRGDRGKVTDECADHCAWVLAGEGVATEKLDGTNVRLTTRNYLLVRTEKRRNPTKHQKNLGMHPYLGSILIIVLNWRLYSLAL